MSNETQDASEVILDTENICLAIMRGMNVQQAGAQLSSAPLAISLLGQVTAIAAEGQDFSLISDGAMFARLTHPRSIKACIMQIQQEVCKAFSKAHSNMYRIRLEIQNVPQLRQDIVDVIQDPEETANVQRQEIELNVRQLKRISNSGCQLTAAVVQVFNDALQTMEELNRSIQAAQGIAGEKLQEAQGDIKVQNERQKTLTNDLEETLEDLADTKKKRDEIEESLKKRLEDANSFANLERQFLASAVDVFKNNAHVAVKGLTMSQFAKSATDMESGITAASSAFKDMADKGMEVYKMHVTSNTGQVLEEDNDEASHNQRRLIHLALALSESADGILKEYLQEDKGWKNLISGKSTKKYVLNLDNLKGLVTCHETIAKYVESTRTDVNNYDSPRVVVQQVLDLCEGWGNIAELLKDAAEMNDGSCGQDIREERDRLLAALKRLEESTTTRGQGQGVPAVQQQALKQGKQMANVAASLHEQMLKALEVEQALMKMKDKQKEWLQKRLDQDREELRKSQELLAKLQTEARTQEGILKFISEGLSCLVNMRDHWLTLQGFFDDINAWAEKDMGEAITSLVDVHGQKAIKGDIFTERALRKLNRDADKMDSTAIAAECLTKAYLSCSYKHFLPMIRTVGQIVVSPNEEARTQQQRLLSIKAIEAQAAIPETLHRMNNTFQEKFIRHTNLSKKSLKPS